MGIDPSTNNDDLFGDSPASATAVDEPEIDPGTEEPSGEETEVAETEPAEEAEVEQPEEVEEELQVVLPRERAKQYSNALMSHYAKRLGANPEDLAGNQPLQKAVKQLIDQDIFIEKQKATATAEPVKKEEVKKEENQPQPAPDLEKHIADLKQRVSEYTDPNVRSNFLKQLNAVETREGQFEILELAAANLFNTMLEKRFGEVFTNYTSTQQRANDERIAAHSAAWTPLVAKNPSLNKDALVAYEEAFKIEPELVQNPALSAEQRMRTVALVLGGRKAEAEVVAKAAEKGKEQGAKAERKAGLGKLGAGQSTAAIAKKTTGNDDVFGAIGESPMSQRLTGKYSS